ncbi:MAG: ABC transporter ATP-binding protein [Bacillota bacterium]
MERRKEKLKLINISKTYIEKNGKTFMAIKDVSIDVYDNEFLVLLGPGLCGKTVLLNIIAGLEEATGGSVLLDGKEINGPNRNISMVFQKLGLMPWKTVMENVEIGLKYAGIPLAERRKTAQRFIDLVGLTGFENAYPRQLSGGMKQRVGIARAYAANTDVLLLDEPFGQLDAQTRYSMQEEILKTWEKEKRTIIFVTNNIEEALYLGDRIVLLKKCPAEVKEIYEITIPRPRNLMAQEFLDLRKKISYNMDLPL